MKLLNKAFSKTYVFHPYLKYPQTNFNKIFTVLKYIPFSITPRLLIHEQWVLENIYILKYDYY